MPQYRDDSRDRMIRAVERVCDRLRSAVRALEVDGVPLAVADGHAVAACVSRVDQAAVRNTQDVDSLLRRSDLGADRIVFARELLRRTEPVPGPDVDESESTSELRLLALDALVRMKLTAFRDKDRVHLRDMVAVGLIDAAWPQRLPAALAERLQQPFANPDG